MSTTPQFIIDDKGNKNFVILSFKEWEVLKSFQRKAEILTGIQNGIKEVNQSRISGKKLQKLADFLDESSR